MAYTKFFQLGKQFNLAFVVQMVHARPAIGGNNAKFASIRLQQPGCEIASFPFQVAEDQYLMSETLFGVGTMVCFDDAPIEGQVHR
jgi:hypothetical protein